MKNLTVILNLFQGLSEKGSAPEKSGQNGEHNFVIIGVLINDVRKAVKTPLVAKNN
ncbi:hypothetical protein [Roseivirga thermotolerans]|uniref:hypothetical protein n=1 Tax=Roseivirga thermotolerans TaxID=1758176 RepID=UPI0016779B55|nr:hypothetical protein [Roseivirga thermotolerans]